MAQEDILNKITNVLGLSVNQREVLSDYRYDTISTIIHWNYEKIHKWYTTKSKLTTTRGRFFMETKKSSAYRRCHGGPPI